MLLDMMALITLICLGLILYHHFAYPLLLRAVSRLGGGNETDSSNSKMDLDKPEHLPTIDVIMPAYNEAQWIEAKLLNLSTLDYPADKLSVQIYCDGCSDNTAHIAQRTLALPECQHLQVTLYIDKQNRGKIARLNQGINRSQAQILALTDVSALISVDALWQAARCFADPQIGVVNSSYKLLESGSAGEAQYWQYQDQIKQAEGQISGPIGAHGALYFVRNQPDLRLDPNTINDDFVLPMQLIAQGSKGAQLAQINAIELEASATEQDLHRRKRLGAGNIQQLIKLKKVFHPKYGKTALIFASGKGLRPLIPLLAIIMLFGSLLLASNNLFFALLSVAQVSLYLAAWLCHCFPSLFQQSFFKAAHYLVTGHLFSFIGAINYLIKSK